MAYINGAVAEAFAAIAIRINDGGAPSEADFVTDDAITATSLEVPALQDITVTNNASTFRWKELGALSEKVVTTVASNSVAGNVVLDPDAFFGTGMGSDAPGLGIFNISNEKRKVDFLVLLNGLGAGKRYFMGSGYLTSVAPAVSADSPVWVSPFTIEVDGDFTVDSLT